jgi:thiosulfate/3-mercaptopyruvate sulfurtransferase
LPYNNPGNYDGIEEKCMSFFMSALTCSLLAGEADYPNAKLLIEAADLAKPETAKPFRILDVRPKTQYSEGHIPGAAWADMWAWSKLVADKPADAGWPQRLAQLGIGPTTAVVVYSADVREAARVWWILKLAGVEDARILNGGWTAWQEGKFPIDKQEPAFSIKVNSEGWKAHLDRHASKEDVLGLLKDKSAQIIDARSEGEFCGDAQTAKRNGSIPGAIHLEWSDLIDQKTKKFKTADELKRLTDERKIDLSKPAVTYCQSGGRAAALAFGLELMGDKQVRNYYRSWSEWGNLEDTPVEKAKK